MKGTEVNISDFKHKYKVTVRFSEVDMLGVTNNAVYINFFEDARLQYIKEAGLLPPNGIFSDGSLFFIVRNEINYRSHSRYDDELTVYTSISYVKNSSFGFRHLVVNNSSGEVIADGSGVIVHVDPGTRKALPLGDEFISKIKAFEPNAEILRR